ncbi:MAG: MBL fold metallo-hydrolase [Flavobacteriales bacterium]
MVNLFSFTFNPFQENTYIIVSGNKCAIVDPGCYTREEQLELKSFIQEKNLEAVLLLNTHCHIDHVLGNAFVCREYGIIPLLHVDDLKQLKSVSSYAHLYGFDGYEISPEPQQFIKHGDKINIGELELEVRHVPGHAPGHIVFISHTEKWIINGDSLFNGSIGRTDLPGGNHDQLLRSIKSELYSLPDDYTVYCGHGPETTIGWEKENNPFVRG